jgi:hypothetical protein
MRWAILLLIISLSACKNRNPPCLIDATDILKGSSSKLITIKDSNNRIVALYDAGWDSLKGGAYLFYPNQFLKSYTFYQNKVAVYTENYDEHGYLTHTMGSPMVNRVINELGEDSAYVEVYFYKPLKSYQQLNIKINNKPAVNYKLETDTNFSNMKSVIFGINTGDLTHINMYSRIKYLDECSKAEHILSDSLFLIKDAHNELSPANSK